MKGYYVYFKCDEEPKVIKERLSIEKQKEMIGADFLDTTRLKSTEEYSFIATVDDEGMLVNKKLNKLFYGDFLVSKIDKDGFEVEMTEEDIKEVISMISSVKDKHSDPVVNTFLQGWLGMLDGSPIMFEYESEKFGFNMINVSLLEVVQELLKNEDENMTKFLRDLATKFELNLVGKDYIIEIFKDFAEQIAKSRHLEIEKKFNVG